MEAIYIATGMPEINILISFRFQLLSIMECTFFCAVMHNFLCKKGDHAFLLKGDYGFRKDFNVFKDG